MLLYDKERDFDIFFYKKLRSDIFIIKWHLAENSVLERDWMHFKCAISAWRFKEDCNDISR